jgi:hypothetical protein
MIIALEPLRAAFRSVVTGGRDEREGQRQMRLSLPDGRKRRYRKPQILGILRRAAGGVPLACDHFAPICNRRNR